MYSWSDRRRRRLPCHLLGVALVSLLLSGCVQAKLELAIDRDGGGGVSYFLSLDRSVAGFLSEGGRKDPLAELKAEAEAKGFEVRTFADAKNLGLVATRHLDNLSGVRTLDELTPAWPGGHQLAAWIPARGRWGQDGEQESPVWQRSVIVRESPWATDYYLKATFDARGVNDLSSADVLLSAPIISRVRLRFIVRLPARVDQTNAPIISEDGRTLEWPLTPGKKTEIELRTRVLHLAPVLRRVRLIKWQVLGVLVATVVLWGWRRRVAGRERRATGG